MGRERSFFLPLPALWDPDVSGREKWGYSPECVEGVFSEVRIHEGA